MLTKEELISLWCKYAHKNVPEQYKPLFSSDGIKRLVEGTFLTKDEQDLILNSVGSLYCSKSLTDDFVNSFIWDEDHWKQILEYCIKGEIIERPANFNKSDVIDGILCMFGISKQDIPHINPVEITKRFYNNTEYGYFGFPYLIDVATYFNIDIKEYLSHRKGFIRDEDVPTFDMNNWHQYFKNSKQITTLKNSVTDGKMLNADGFPKYDSDNFDHFKIAEAFYPYAEKMWKIHQVIGNFIPLRKIDDGAGYIEELISEYGNIIGFYDKTPIYKVKTVQGFNFYILGSNWLGGVYIDDISIKKIYFGKYIANKGVSKDKRIFIIYNEDTGYWRLPELNYPEVYKNFIKDIINKHKDEIGDWNKTHVFASSRTLNSFVNGIDKYPDIKSKDEFIEKIVNSAAKLALAQLHLDMMIEKLGLSIEIKYKSDNFDFDTMVKPIDLTQDDIDKYCNIDTCKDIFEITKY
ncbi:MAG: hypothetical protein [Wendovervirus sonii]|uniref:Terminase large subunit n=1 Tax=phage Lak_Megaphage_Sonny TaxID=3109229 RepID=A0ABZ0Z3F3_9CAUD|nr:MAG: hypothetical protein [phage Lak_Megaphage_Sonny]